LALIQRVASMKSTAELLCSSMPVAIAKRLGSKMMSSGGIAQRVVGQHLGLDDQPVERAVHRPLPRGPRRALDLA
jgi:hypothetical protein